ncbi:hypothetical protein M1141_00995 [Candidatus Marsarchaeota archaeon]|nr:hypothetical protein [Candidatus Marsarchaeota archaeon]
MEISQNGIKKYAMAFAVYAVIALALFSNIFANAANNAVASGTGLYATLFNLWWANYAVFHLHSSIWHTSLLFWPVGASMMQNLSLLSSILVAPFGLASNALALNALMFLSLAISGLGMFALAFYMLKNYYSALISGAVFSFSAFHIAQYFGNIGFFVIAWAPLSLLFLIKILNNEKHALADSVGFGLSFALACLMGSMKQGFVLILLFGALGIAYALKKDTRKLLGRHALKYIALGAGIAFVAGAFEFVPYAMHAGQTISLNRIQMQGTLMKYYSLNALSLFVPSYYNTLFNLGPAIRSMFYLNPWQRIGYIGYAALALAAFGVYRNRSAWKFAAIAIAFAFLALGPFLQIGAATVYSNIYYFIYMHIPFISLIAQPSLFMLAASVMIALLAGAGADSLHDVLRKNRAGQNLFYAAAAAIIFISVIESAGLPFLLPATAISTPRFFSYAKNISQNFSILYLPAFPNYNSTDPFYYQSLSSYYAATAGKGIVGGYSQNENKTQQMLLLDLPIAIQAYSLQAIGAMRYVSMINENYSNQTTLLLYNYNTQYIVLNRNAYNQSDLVALGGYLTTLFGKPVYVSNSTVAFSTSKAFKNVYKSYTGYPQFNTWQMINREINGTTFSLWNPNESFEGMRAGLIAEFAPYANSTLPGINAANATINATIDTKISFYGVSNSPSEVIIAKFGIGNNSRKLEGIARFNVTNRMQEFSANTQLYSGPKGNLLVFIVPDNSTGIYNMSFSKT